MTAPFLGVPTAETAKTQDVSLWLRAQCAFSLLWPERDTQWLIFEDENCRNCDLTCQSTVTECRLIVGTPLRDQLGKSNLVIT